MKISSVSRLLLAGVVAFGLSACASSGGGMAEEGMEGEGIEFTVVNDRAPASSVTVYLIPQSGGRERLGFVNPNQTQTFRHDPTAPNQDFYLVAEAVGESDIRSERFNLLNVGEVQWSTANRSVRVR